VLIYRSRSACQIKIVPESATFDRNQLREVTLDDPDLMREILAALIDDTSRQIDLIASAIRQKDSQLCKRLAHYSKGACANVGANAAAALLRDIEFYAARGQFSHCETSLAALAQEMERLRNEV
jgi:HPt (histidine-containing phosphotransfer) domain-containing protein